MKKKSIKVKLVKLALKEYLKDNLHEKEITTKNMVDYLGNLFNFKTIVGDVEGTGENYFFDVTVDSISIHINISHSNTALN